MPEETIVAIWRVAIVRSRGLTWRRNSMLSSLDPALSADVQDDEPVAPPVCMNE